MHPRKNVPLADYLVNARLACNKTEGGKDTANKDSNQSRENTFFRTKNKRLARGSGTAPD